ncbi:MAG TPA: DNA-directed RNA polymerase subunit B, partial [Candidatus Nanoarchaeia archaeon]|nr:DNA-directed RNA polymerase subunit B [Candidatus Nanoarchaeia archaeon]
MVTEIYLNNKFLGVVDNGKAFVEDFRESRRKGTLDPSVNVCYDKDNEEIHIESTGGRAQRPLLVLKDGKILLEEKHLKQLEEGKINWKDLVKQGMVEFLDALEEENALVAYSEKEITPKHTHLEISPSALCGIVTSLVPFANFNQPPRLIIGSKNQKQSLGFYAGNYPIRLDMDISLLHYPQVPIVRTKVHDLIHLEQHPAGQNVVLAIMSYDGYTIEDALVINRSSLDRGLYRSTYFRPVETEELRYSGGLVDEICIPDKDVKGYRTEHEYRLLEEDGIIFPEAKAAEGD